MICNMAYMVDEILLLFVMIWAYEVLISDVTTTYAIMFLSHLHNKHVNEIAWRTVLREEKKYYNKWDLIQKLNYTTCMKELTIIVKA